MNRNRNISEETRRIRDYKNRDKSVEAADRMEEANRRNAQEQIDVLDTRLGKGIGAARERQRLHKKMGVKREAK